MITVIFETFWEIRDVLRKYFEPRQHMPAWPCITKIYCSPLRRLEQVNKIIRAPWVVHAIGYWQS